MNVWDVAGAIPLNHRLIYKSRRVYEQVSRNSGQCGSAIVTAWMPLCAAYSLLGLASADYDERRFVVDSTDVSQSTSSLRARAPRPHQLTWALTA
jgi:hypothetical protein